MTDADLLAAYRQLTQAGGDGSGADTNGPDAFTFAGFGTADGSAFESGVTDTVFFRLQGTGTANTATVADRILTVIAIFQPVQFPAVDD
jgi:hypothetical protein